MCAVCFLLPKLSLISLQEQNTKKKKTEFKGALSKNKQINLVKETVYLASGGSHKHPFESQN